MVQMEGFHWTGPTGGPLCEPPGGVPLKGSTWRGLEVFIWSVSPGWVPVERVPRGVPSGVGPRRGAVEGSPWSWSPGFDPVYGVPWRGSSVRSPWRGVWWRWPPGGVPLRDPLEESPWMGHTRGVQMEG